MSLRIPPHSVEAEQSVLGGLMLDNQMWYAIDGYLSAADFYRHDHRLIFAAIQSLATADAPLDMVTLAERLKDTEQLQDAGGLPYLGQLASDTPSAANLPAYARIVHDKATLRKAIALAEQGMDRAFKPEDMTGEQVLLDLEGKLQRLVDDRARSTKDTLPIKSVIGDAVAYIEEMFETKNPVPGLPSGFQDLDHATTGFHPGDLVVVGGRPGSGKTSFAMNVAEHAVIKGHRVLVFSMEMPARQLGLRLIASLGRISFEKLRTGRMEDADWPSLTSAVSMLTDGRLHINAKSAQTVATIRAEARRVAKAEGKLGLIVIDYLTKIPGEGENQNLRVAEVIQGLKAIGMELDVPVLVLAQLSRAGEKEKRPPVVTDIRDSGVVEQEADLILLLDREELRDPETTRKGVADLKVAKFRNGESGQVIPLTFLGPFMRFENYHPDVHGIGRETWAAHG